MNTTTPKENAMTKTCTTCGKPVDKPWREYHADGTLRFGCVAADHDGHADAWHARQDAAAIRLATRRRLAGASS